MPPGVLKRAPLKHRLRKATPNALRSVANPLGQGKPEKQQVPRGAVGAKWPITAGELFDAGRRFEREPYSTAGGRTSITSGYADCSGFICKAHLYGTGRVYPQGASVSTSQETSAIAAGGRYVTRDYARSHPCVMCFIYGFGPKGHVEWSAPGGQYTFGTPSDVRDPNNRDVGFSPWDNNGWTAYVALPGIIYEGAAPPAPPQFETDDEEDDMSDTLARWTENNLPSEWHVAFVNPGGDLVHMWGPKGDIEFLAGPTVPNTARRTPGPVTKVTSQKGVAGDGGRIDLFLEINGFFGVGHLFRSRNNQPWSWEVKKPG